MPGGLLNLVSYGNLNVILNGNPSKTFFKTTYAKHTNFGLQKFRIDFDGLRVLRLSEDSHFSFKIPRYADLLMDTYLVITLPTIWSPMIIRNDHMGEPLLIPYEFKWIENLGTQLIKKIRFMIGGQIIQEFTGQYLYNMVQRDFSEGKKKLFDQMTGNIPELNDPANYSNRDGYYPNACHVPEVPYGGSEPSIRSRTLYIPLNIWSTLSSKMAIPLVSLQYNYFHIEVECRPIQELFVIRDVLHPGLVVSDMSDNYISPLDAPYIKAGQNESAYAFYRFLQQPPVTSNGTAIDDYPIKRSDWSSEIHLLSTYGFLSEKEQKVFAAKSQQYLIKEDHEETFHNVIASQRTKLNSIGLISSWMWFFQRSDVNLRNEWSNYTNWPYKGMPYPYTDVEGMYLKVSGQRHPENQHDIMHSWGLLLDGKIRESTMDAGVFNLVEKYVKTMGNSDTGLHCYNFCLNTDPFIFQPSGAINLSKFSTVEFEYTLHTPPRDLSATVITLCGRDGSFIGTRDPKKLYNYNYNLHVMEERYNILTFESGNANLMFAR